jgi:anthranilate 1,2-dioxygenase small subunit
MANLLPFSAVLVDALSRSRPNWCAGAQAPLRWIEMDSEQAKRAIEALIHDYAHTIDDDRLEEWPDYFTDECLYRVISKDSHEHGLPIGIMVCEGLGMLRDRIVALRVANIYEPHSYRHLISAIRFLGEETGTYRVQTGFAVIRTMQTGDISVFLSGKYLDKVVFVDGRPKFRERQVVCDSATIDTLIVIPP